MINWVSRYRKSFFSFPLANSNTGCKTKPRELWARCVLAGQIVLTNQFHWAAFKGENHQVKSILPTLTLS